MNTMTLPLETFEQLSLLDKQNIIEASPCIMQTTILGNDVTYYKADGYYIKVTVDKDNVKEITAMPMR